MDRVEGTRWTEGAARAVRAATEVLRDDAPDLLLTVDQLKAVLITYTDAHPDQLGELRDEIENLKVALLSRATIEQAKGILMGTTRCKPDEAFEMLIRASQRENVKLRDIALRIVEHASQPEAG